MRVMLGGATDPRAVGLDDAALMDVVRRDLRTTMGLDLTPEFVKIFRHPTGIPQYTVGHLDRLARAEARLVSLPGDIAGRQRLPRRGHQRVHRRGTTGGGARARALCRGACRGRHGPVAHSVPSGMRPAASAASCGSLNGAASRAVSSWKARNRCAM